MTGQSRKRFKIKYGQGKSKKGRKMFDALTAALFALFVFIVTLFFVVAIFFFVSARRDIKKSQSSVKGGKSHG